MTVGRTFDGHVLDMAELGVESATTLAELQSAFPDAQVTQLLNPPPPFPVVVITFLFPNSLNMQILSKRVGSKPCVVFVGEPWDSNSEFRQLRSLLLDLVRGQDVTGVNLAALDHVIAFTAAKDKVFMRTYALLLRKPAEGSVPRVKLVLSAPAADFK